VHLSRSSKSEGTERRHGARTEAKDRRARRKRASRCLDARTSRGNAAKIHDESSRKPRRGGRDRSYARIQRIQRNRQIAGSIHRIVVRRLISCSFSTIFYRFLFIDLEEHLKLEFQSEIPSKSSCIHPPATLKRSSTRPSSRVFKINCVNQRSE